MGDITLHIKQYESDNDPESKHLFLIQLIAWQYLWRHHSKNHHNNDIRETTIKSKQRVAKIKERKETIRSEFKQKIEDRLSVIRESFKRHKISDPYKNTEELARTSLFTEALLSGYSLKGPKLEDIHGWIRKAEEKVLLSELGISARSSSLENWALIGMALANNQPTSILSYCLASGEKGRRSKGRPSKGLMSRDYDRAVWILDVQGFFLELLDNVISENTALKVSGVPHHTLLFEAYKFALEKPEKHNYLKVFMSLESKLKMKSISPDTFETSFYRGDRQRAELWGEGPNANLHERWNLGASRK